MARDYANKNAKKSGRRKPAKRRIAWKAWLVTLLLIMLFAGCLYYLSLLDNGGTKKASKAKPSTKTAQSTAEKTAPQKPRFEFYTILPESKQEAATPLIPATEDAKPQSTISKQSTADDMQLFQLQVASFRNFPDADRLNAELTLMGFDVGVQTINGNDGTWYRVRVGPFNSRDAAERAQQRLKANQYTSLLRRTTG